MGYATAIVLFAQENGNPGKKEKNILEDSDFLIWTGILLGVLLLGAVIFAWLDKWRRRQMDGETFELSPATYDEMYANGEISKQEYDRIRAKMAKRQVGKVSSPAKPTQLPSIDPLPPTDSNPPG